MGPGSCPVRLSSRSPHSLKALLSRDRRACRLQRGGETVTDTRGEGEGGGGGCRNVIKIQTCSQGSRWFVPLAKTFPPRPRSRTGLVSGADLSLCGALERLLESLMVRSAPNRMQVGAADGQEPHMVLMSLKNTQQRKTAQRAPPRRQPLAKSLGRIQQMEPVCVRHLPQLPKKKFLLLLFAKTVPVGGAARCLKGRTNQKLIG